jgi:hypothetical protein
VSSSGMPDHQMLRRCDGPRAPARVAARTRLPPRVRALVNAADLVNLAKADVGPLREAFHESARQFESELLIDLSDPPNFSHQSPRIR